MTNRQTMSFGSDVAPRQSFGLRNAVAEPEPTLRSTDFDTALWLRLVAMSLDVPGAETPVSRRLQIENGWTASETDRAIVEYKRFLYLTQRAGFEVTPSRPVDLVWHEHLMHTKHYWGTLCREVLRNDLHHNPGSGGAIDGERLSDQYQRTLDAYAQAFGEAAPEDIWPRPVARRRRGRTASVIAVVALPVAVFALFTKVWPLLLVSGFVFFAALATAANQASAEKRRQDRGGCGSGCGGGGIGSTGCADGASGDGGASSSDSGSGDGGGGGCGGGGD